MKKLNDNYRPNPFRPIPPNMSDLPSELWAIISSYLRNDPACDLIRDLAKSAKDWVIDIDNSGSSSYCNGVLHSRNDQPAVIHEDHAYPPFYRAWYKWGELHRVGGPALEFYCGASIWYLDGQIHRDGDEPAIEIKNKELHCVGNLFEYVGSPIIEQLKLTCPKKFIGHSIPPYSSIWVTKGKITRIKFSPGSFRSSP